MARYYTIVLLLSLVVLVNCAKGEMMSYGDFFKTNLEQTTESPKEAHIINVKCKFGYILVHRKCRKVF
ncbi:unnamed protein product [Phyllotreta striolata]|uniref:Uncharacterized protein n=1 Tax=Phyllotreta striolata TaxID=444603 RepID=A0A9N9TB55_PHYSR|nr:unnamed protein product [Phyllotreta striolata]